MAIAAQSLLIGLLVGVLLALFASQFVSHLHLPAPSEATNTASRSPLSQSREMARFLKDIAKRGAGGYKSLWAAPPLSIPSLLRPTAAAFSSQIPSPPSFSTTANMSAQKTFFDAVKERRTYYQLNKEAPISDKQITDIAEKAVLHVPSSFNSQSTRLVVLLNKDHDTFWDYVLEVLKPMVPEEQFSGTQQKINGFKAAYGTVSTLCFGLLVWCWCGGCPATRARRVPHHTCCFTYPHTKTMHPDPLLRRP
jgi:hypothetical protein